MLAASSTELEATAQSMTGTARQTNQQATVVTAAAAQASIAVHTVASTAEELTSSIGEISRQVAHAADMTGKAVINAQRTDAIVRALAEGAQKIGEVVGLISNIASQTNLLALEQGAATAGIARSVQQTALATREVTVNIAGVSQAAHDSGAAAGQVLDAAGDLSRQAEQLSSKVDCFVTEVRAA